MRRLGARAVSRMRTNWALLTFESRSLPAICRYGSGVPGSFEEARQTEPGLV
jgi:hypothetical protein